MKASTRWVLGVVSAWVAVMAAVITVSGAQQPSSPTVPPGDKSPQQIAFERFQRAERVLNGSCSVTGCHTIRPIQTAAKDQEGWTKTVDTMIEKGAKLELPDDKDILIQYLVQQHGPLPEGELKRNPGQHEMHQAVARQSKSNQCVVWPAAPDFCGRRARGHVMLIPQHEAR